MNKTTKMDLRQILSDLKQGNDFSFTVPKNELEFEVNNTTLNSILNPTEQLIEFLLMDSTGMIEISKTNRLLLLVKTFNGNIIIEEENESNWKVNTHS
jgi:hypothetical protein